MDYKNLYFDYKINKYNNIYDYDNTKIQSYGSVLDNDLKSQLAI